MLYQLPIRTIIKSNLVPDDDRVPGDDRHLADVDLDQGIDVRVAWNGDMSDRGTLEVLFQQEWTALANLQPGTPNEQVAPGNGEQVTCVKVRRHGEARTTRFAVRLLPVAWIGDEPAPEEHEREVTLGHDYDYALDGKEADEYWKPSAPDNRGVHHAIVHDLEVGRAYEMGVRLWHPNGSDEDFKDQDPVVHTGPPTGGNSED